MLSWIHQIIVSVATITAKSTNWTVLVIAADIARSEVENLGLLIIVMLVCTSGVHKKLSLFIWIVEVYTLIVSIRV